MMKKHFLKGIFLCLCLFSGINTFAYDTEIDGIFYEFSGDNEATVTYDDEDYTHYSGAVVIPASVTHEEKTYSVTSIGESAFDGCSDLTSVTIPSSVTSIGVYAFDGCSGLTSVTINSDNIVSNTDDGSSLKDIFGSQVTRYVFGDGIEGIGDYACAGCDNLTSVSIPSSVETIGSNAFQGCSGLTSITIPNNVTSIGVSAFDGCSDLTSVTIPSSVTSIGEYAFWDCNSLPSVTIPSSVTSIGDGAFGGCDILTSVTINSNYVASNKVLQDIFGDQVTTYVFGDGVRSIRASACDGCRSLTSVTIPYGVTSIGDDAFKNSGLTSITIPNSVTSIGSSAFDYCSSLTSVTIPSSVTSIGVYAFDDCSSLTSVTINSNNIASHTYEDGSGLASIFGSQVTTYVFGEGVEGIGDYACDGCSSLTSVTIPSGVTSIGEGAFKGCSGLTSITIPSDVTSIGEGAFKNCVNLTSITIPNGVTSISNETFNNCRGLTSVTIPNGVTSIGESAFDYCSGLTKVTIPNSVISIGIWAFDCSKLTQVYIYKETPIDIDESAFTNRASATLYVPYGCGAAYADVDPWSKFGAITEMPDPNSITVGSSGYATFCSQNALDFSDVTDIKAYIASEFDNSTYTLTLTRITEAPAGEGLYIVGTPGTYTINETTTDEVYSNLLTGVTYPTTINPTDGNNTNFILANGTHGVAFYTISRAGELAAGKAYLQLPTEDVEADVKALNIVFDDDNEDSISRLSSDSSRNGEEVYNLQGQRVDKAQKGIFIVNGKKLFIK